MKNNNQIYDIIVVAGQSNAEGTGIGPVTEEYVANENILCLSTKVSNVIHGEERIITYPDKTLTISIAQERMTKKGQTGDFSLSFAAEYLKNNLLASGRKILIIQAAVGGTGFQQKQWGTDCPVEMKMHEMIEYALSLNKENKLIAFLWHQGEQDAFERNVPDNYEKQLTDLVATVRKKYACEDIPFIAGDFCSEWKNKNLEICNPIVDKIKRVFSKEHCGFVDTADLLSNNQKVADDDDIHFCRESLHILGRRYFEKYCELVR